MGWGYAHPSRRVKGLVGNGIRQTIFKMKFARKYRKYRKVFDYENARR